MASYVLLIPGREFQRFGSFWRHKPKPVFIDLWVCLGFIAGRCSRYMIGQRFPFFDDFADQQRLGVYPDGHLALVYLVPGSAVNVGGSAIEAAAPMSTDIIRSLDDRIRKIGKVAWQGALGIEQRRDLCGG